MATGRATSEQQHRKAVAAYVAAGGEESVQRVITALYGVTKKLDQWYARQCSDLGLSQGEWAVLAALAKAHESEITPSQLAEQTSVAPSSMTHRLDKMEERGLLAREHDPSNRTRVLVTLTPEGWDMFTAAIRQADVVESDTLRPLSDDERHELARLLEIVIAGLDDIEP